MEQIIKEYQNETHEENLYLMFDFNKLYNQKENDMYFIMKYNEDGVMQILDAFPLE